MTQPLATYTTYDGAEYTVLERPESSDGALVMQFRLPPRAGVPPPHVHPHTVEIFEVLEGEFETLLRKEWRKLRAGESVTVEPGARHTFRNESGSEVVVRNVHEPHHDFEAYIRSIANISRETQSASPSSPAAAIRMALLWGRHEDLIRPADPPLKAAFPVLRGVGRMARMSTPA